MDMILSFKVNNFCDQSFWNQSLFWSSDSPQLTDCFSQTVLPLLPLIVLLTLLPYDLYIVRSFNNKLPPIPYQWKNILVLLIVLCLSIIQTINISKVTTVSKTLIISELFLPLIKLITYLLITRLVLYFRECGYRHPISLPIQWMFTLFVSLIELYQTLITNDWKFDIFSTTLKCLEVLIILKVLVTSCLSPKVTTFQSLDNKSHSNCPMTEYNVFSRIFFLWVIKILKYGYKANKDLIQYLEPICYYLKSKNSFKTFESADKKYNEGKQLKNKSLLPLILSTVWTPLLAAILLGLCEICLNFIQPYFLSKLIDFVSGDDPYRWHGFYYAIAYCLFNIIARLFDSHSFFLLVIMRFRIGTALTIAVYKKMLNLSPDSRREWTTGDINNLMGADIPEVSSLALSTKWMFTIPISSTIGIYYLWQYLGPASLTIFGIMLIISPITTWITRYVDTLREKQMEFRDKRMEELSEILNNIKLIKLFGWEKPFMERITKTRAQELYNQLKSNYYWSAIEVLWTVTPMLTAGLSFTVFTLVSGLPLTPKTAFVSISLLNLLRQPIARFPDILSKVVKTIVSFKRIRKYLNSEELEQNLDDYLDAEDFGNDLAIEVKNSSFKWRSTDEPVLKDINLNIREGSLVAIVGRVGSGKSSIFSALMGDMYCSDGSPSRVFGSVAYVPQTAWIQNLSLKENILFVSDYETNKYERVVDACALKPDIDLLPAGDMTEIGEKGINLSGGQKHRVSLARAVYQDSDIYLLDDPLSAVDAHVTQHLFQRVIGPNGLLSQKTRILATHRISFLKDVDHIVVMSNGKITDFGSYDELYAKGLLTEKVLSDIEDFGEDEGTPNDETFELIQSSTQAKELSEAKPTTLKAKLEEQSERAQLIDEENQEFGTIGWDVYSDYFSRLGLFFSLTPLLFAIVFNLGEIGGNYYLNIWSSENSTQIGEQTNQKSFMKSYLWLILMNALLVSIGQTIFRYGAVKATEKLHKDMLFSVMRSPLSFFDTTPLGRIINRFNNDMYCVDDDIPFCMIESTRELIYISIILLSIVYSYPIMTIQLVVVITIFAFLYKLFLWTTRQLYRLDSITRSPVYSHFMESISGAVSIRAYRVQKIFLNKLEHLIDISININKHMYTTTIWIDTWSTIISSIITFSTALIVVIKSDDMTPGMAGFILTYSIEITRNSISWALRMFADMEIAMVSMERIKEYSQLEPEADWESALDCKPSNRWPTATRIEFINYSTSYRKGLDPILKNLNFKIGSGERVGIVGRTGAGKSSLTLALFRIIEPTNGQILIDGVDITKIGLHELRSKLMIIPQEPNLFAGTLKFNLDPFNEYTDKQLWSALESAHLKDFFINSSDGLSYEITEGGDNLSAGQRQLVCLGRALLRNTKILVLDEATAACDLETDLLIQKTIKEKFNDCTVITIAHRLNTVLDYNKIIVLENGIIVEMDSPNNLLKTSDSLFYGLAKEFGIV